MLGVADRQGTQRSGSSSRFRSWCQISIDLSQYAFVGGSGRLFGSVRCLVLVSGPSSSLSLM